MIYAVSEVNNAGYKLEKKNIFRLAHSWEIRTPSLKSILLVVV